MRMTDTHVFFWGGIFSNWCTTSQFDGRDALQELMAFLCTCPITFPALDAPITLRLASHRYNCNEQWMMAAKAWLFEDEASLKAIQKCSDPKGQKSLGRKVANFDQRIWEPCSVPIVAAGIIARFDAHPPSLRILLDTGNRVLVEGSPYDRVWGVGLRWDSPEIESPANWRGQNKLGEAYAMARPILQQRHQG